MQSTIRVLLGILALATSVAANGILLPKDHQLPPLAIKDQKVTVEIDQNLARTKVDQIFVNHTDRPLEAVFVFPLPRGAKIDEFAMMMNGKRVKGEVLEKDKARAIYTSIVRRMRDPGLIEHLGNNLFRASIFPVPARGNQKIELSYSQVVRPDAGLAEYVYPLKVSGERLQVVGNFSVFVHLKSKVPLKNIYCPTHPVDIVRKSDHEAKISFEQRGATLNRNLQLFYSVSPDAIGLNLMAHREKDADGYFMLMLAPRVDLDRKEIDAKDVCFVLDTSGSMSGKKMDQAREALAYCVNSLNPDDRFNIVRFSTEVDVFESKLQAANKANKAKAVSYIKKLDARGGTDINGALTKALEFASDGERPYLVVFLTDGHPTIGVTDDREILRNLKSNNKNNTRIFAWGVGHELNAVLLDQIADNTGATTQYVGPEENLEVKISSFFDKVSSPVLSNLSLDYGNADAFQVYPKELGDLFKGQQLTIFGRYRKEGHTALTLTGTVNGEKKTYTFETSFPETVGEASFVAGLWASRKVGYLLEEIRLHGEKKELVEEVVRLAREFGIVTPYTSYLVVEDDRPVVVRPPHDPHPRPPHLPHPPIRPMPLRRQSKALEEMDVQVIDEPAAAEEKEEMLSKSGAADALASRRREAETSAERFAGGMSQTSGKDAVGASETLRKLKKADVVQNLPSSTAGRRLRMQRVGTRSFAYAQGVWVDQDWDPEKTEPVKIIYLSDAWFQLLEAKPALKKVFALGKQVLVQLDNGKTILVVVKDGRDRLSKKELQSLLD